MDIEVKKKIVEASKIYASENGLGQEAIAELAGVNISYINTMWQGNFSIKGKGNKSTPIKDLYFKKVAKTVGVDYEQRYWDLVETPQYIEIYTELVDAKKKGYMKMLIGETGCGKTFTVNKFVKDFPLHTYRITVSDLHNIGDIVSELSDLLGIHQTGARIARLSRISDKIRDIRLGGGKPVLIIDEAENLRIPSIRMMKALYDMIVDYCSIVLIGTSQLSDKLDILNEKNTGGMPQFCRRFKAGRRMLPAINKAKMFTPFLEKVEDTSLRELLQHRCNNYGELNNFLEPAMREADMFGEELTEEFFCNMYHLNRSF